MRYYSRAKIEEIVARRITELEAFKRSPVSPPIEIELFAEGVLGLQILWEDIEELPGEVVLGALQPETRTIVLNQARAKLFEDKPGLERFTIGHECGHWDLFGEAHSSENLELFPDANGEALELRSTNAGDVCVISPMINDPELQSYLRARRLREDSPNQRSAVNRYAGALLMPASVLRAEVDRVGPLDWQALYGIKDRYGVTISALCVRLAELRIASVRGKQIVPYGVAPEGQKALYS